MICLFLFLNFCMMSMSSVFQCLLNTEYEAQKLTETKAWNSQIFLNKSLLQLIVLTGTSKRQVCSVIYAN